MMEKGDGNDLVNVFEDESTMSQSNIMANNI